MMQEMYKRNPVYMPEQAAPFQMLMVGHMNSPRVNLTVFWVFVGNTANATALETRASHSYGS